MATLSPTAPVPSHTAPALPAKAGVTPPRAGKRWTRWLQWGVPLLAAGVLAALGGRALMAPSVTPVRYETAAIDRGGIDAKVTATGTVSPLVTTTTRRSSR